MREFSTSTDTTTTYYLYDREDRIADYDQSGTIIQSYTHGPGIDEPVAITTDGNTYFYIPDVQGSIRAIVDTNGNAVATYQYDVWGNLVSYGGSLAEQNDYLYTGREYNWDSGIYYYRARYYNPELGRFLSQDPAGMVDGPNMYIYVKNNPVNGVDPSGTGDWGCTLCILAVTILLLSPFIYAAYDAGAYAVVESALETYKTSLINIITNIGFSKAAANTILWATKAFFSGSGLFSIYTIGKSLLIPEYICAIPGFCPLPSTPPNYQRSLTIGVEWVVGTPLPPPYTGSGGVGGGGRLGIRHMGFSGGMKPQPLPIGPPFWRLAI